MVPRIVPTVVAAAAVVCVLVGVLMLTVSAPPQVVGGRADAAPVLVTAPGALALTGRAVEVAVSGEAFVGLGRAGEVDAWLDGVARTQVDGVSTATTLAQQQVAGQAPDQVDPPADVDLADLWQEQEQGASPSLRVAEPDPEDVLVVVAGSGAGVELSWLRPARHPGAWPLVVGGAVLTVLALVWLARLNARLRRRGGRA